MAGVKPAPQPFLQIILFKIMKLIKVHIILHTIGGARSTRLKENAG